MTEYLHSGFGLMIFMTTSDGTNNPEYSWYSPTSLVRPTTLTTVAPSAAVAAASAIDGSTIKSNRSSPLKLTRSRNLTDFGSRK